MHWRRIVGALAATAVADGGLLGQPGTDPRHAVAAADDPAIDIVAARRRHAEQPALRSDPDAV